MKKLTYLLLCLVLGIGLATAQTRKVTGTVISAEDSEPIIGASVIVKGTTTGTVTDFDGAFSLDVPSSAKTLVFSYVGMVAKEVPIEPVMKVELQSGAQNLSEVVITAMGIPQIYDNIEEFFDLGTTWNNSLNIAQALDRGSYSFSLGSTTQE